jgi:hypothetical protein
MFRQHNSLSCADGILFLLLLYVIKRDNKCKNCEKLDRVI